jgi:hypothetical protein
MKNNSDDNLAQQVMAEMDGLRAEVWHDYNVLAHWRDRLTDTAGIQAQQQHLATFIREFQRQHCAEADLAEIFADAADDLICWQRELEFQRQWVIAASSAHALGKVNFARRLAHEYRLLYGGDLNYEPIDDPLVFQPRTAFAVARKLQRWIWDWSLRYVEWDDQDCLDAEPWLEIIHDRKETICHVLDRRGLLDAPCRTEIGKRLDAAYQACGFRHTSLALQYAWLRRIAAALDRPNLRLASALMRLYSHIFGVVYLIGGHFLDCPTYGAGHVPDAPTEQQVKNCLIDCNRLRVAWVELEDDLERERAARRAPDELEERIAERLAKLGE